MHLPLTVAAAASPAQPMRKDGIWGTRLVHRSGVFEGELALSWFLVTCDKPMPALASFRRGGWHTDYK